MALAQLTVNPWFALRQVTRSPVRTSRVRRPFNWLLNPV